jgi:uncharacterized protein
MNKKGNGESSKTLIEFPCDFQIKVMGKNSPEFIPLVTEIVQRNFPAFTTERLEKRFSQFTNYMSLTVTVHAHSKEQLDQLYRELTSAPNILIVL